MSETWREHLARVGLPPCRRNEEFPMYVSSRNRAPQQRQATPPLVDNPFAAELFATGCAGFTSLGGTVVLTLEAARCDHSGETLVVERVVAGRIALTVAGAQALASGLNQFLQQQGLAPARTGGVQ